MSKVLIVANNSFSSSSNNGKTYEAIFSDFNKADLGQIFFSENESPDLDYCNNYFKITDKDVLINTLTLSGKKGGEINKQNYISNENQLAYSKKKNVSVLFKFLQKRADSLVQLRDLLWSLNFWKTNKLKLWLREYNPQIIFFVAGDMEFPHTVAKWISNELKIPLVIYFTDDYVLNPQPRNFLDKNRKERALNFYKDTIAKSSKLYTIGELMANEYENYFGKSFNFIMNSVDVNPLINYIDDKSDKVIIISYFGGLHLNRWKMISRLGSILNNRAKINVYTIEKPSNDILSAFERASVNYCGPVTGENLKCRIIESDVLLHVESDDQYNRSLTKLSVSTKIPEYLMSGRVILGFGPVEVASMRILSDNDIGYVISSNLNDFEISQSISKIFDFEQRKDLGIKGYDFAVANFSKDVISKKFRREIEALVLNAK